MRVDIHIWKLLRTKEASEVVWGAFRQKDEQVNFNVQVLHSRIIQTQTQICVLYHLGTVACIFPLSESAPPLSLVERILFCSQCRGSIHNKILQKSALMSKKSILAEGGIGPNLFLTGEQNIGKQSLSVYCSSTT